MQDNKRQDGIFIFVVSPSNYLPIWRIAENIQMRLPPLPRSFVLYSGPMRLTSALLLTPILIVSAGLAQTQPPPKAVSLVVLSDFNGAYGSRTYPTTVGGVLRRILNEWQPEVVLSAGDLIAGQKASLTDAQVRAMWAGFDREVYAPLQKAGIPFIFALGNHDASLARDRREAQTYWKGHVPQGVLEGSKFPFQYTLSFKGVFIAVLDANGSDVNTRQREWLRAQLASAPAKAARVRLVMGHLPLSGISADKNKVGEIIRDATPLRKIMVDGRVNLYLSGHHAAYYPGKLGELNVLASGGIGGRDYVGHPGTARSTVTRLFIDLDATVIRFQTFDADTGQEIPTESLPAQIRGLGGTLERATEFK